MEIKKISLVYFSPTGATRRVLQLIAAAFSLPVQEYDLTSALPVLTPAFSQEDLVLLGAPVFSGRVPPIAARRLQALQGNGAPAVLVVAYGQRAFDDALLELQEISYLAGLSPVAAAAVITEHSIVREIGTGRPDEADVHLLDAFAKKLQSALPSLSEPSGVTLHLPGNADYKPWKQVPFHPHASRACTRCGACAAACPVGAIPADRPNETERGLCFTCMRCVAVCPQKARKLHTPEYLASKTMLKPLCDRNKLPEFWL